MAALTVVVGLVLPIANDHVKRGHRANARAALSNAAQWMERTASAQGRYPKAVAIPESVLFVKGRQYTIAAASTDGLAYTLTAHPQGDQASDQCGSFRINHTGVRSQVATAEVPHPLGPMECWAW
ncbi:type IV pilin protein [Hydrogenophaga sp. RAC07]|uniref:type IV pilin protein n=1 Tax=Hydrogenophaga sp. RAC07 TaxID=1842537 RepID=UPI001C12C354|nr:type IV pilin protein [Hydrogenophaga sp. RAC07]